MGIEVGNRLTFWIDAVRIDQESKNKKAAQVSVMDSIYGLKACVLCWLGKAAENTAAAFDRIQQIWDHFAPIFNNRTERSNVWRVIEEHDTPLLRYDPDEPHSVRAWQGIADILQREYFSRTWIVQETAQRSKEKILLCGDFHIVWNAIGILDYVLYAKDVSHQLDLPWKYTTMSAGILFNIRERLKKQMSTTLLDLLDCTNSFGCKHPQDRVYAIRILARDVSRQDLKADYDKPLAEAYKEVVEFCISHGVDRQHLNFLAYASNSVRQIGGDDSEPPMPSWVSDWRKEIAMFPFPTNDVYTPSPGWQPIIRVEGNSLFVEGLELDTIDQISPVCSSQMVRDVTFDPEWHHMWDQHCTERGEQSRAESLECVVVTDALRHGETSRGHQIDWTNARRARDRAGQNYDQSYSSARSFIHTCKGRRLMTTSRGYIGIAPGASEPGYIVCLFFGGQVLYVLREVDKDRYSFIGQSYVHGLMDGGGLSLFEQPLHSKKTFCIV